MAVKSDYATLAPSRPVYQAGTLSGNPIAMAAGLACLTELKKAGNEQHLAELTTKLCDGLKALAQKHNVPFVINHVGGMLVFSSLTKTSYFLCRSHEM